MNYVNHTQNMVFKAKRRRVRPHDKKNLMKNYHHSKQHKMNHTYDFNFVVFGTLYKEKSNRNVS